eukprot:CAMPEP_0119536746 /NCGR_PEP_ID=MMETSP1344-20130328/49531_1 /TAXON_ID=236787 /ORGANISM="Florenciella parvula, Strain CCMP2471" /LENGTH=65 /DNA_ID=CAMNT_0007578933 /DNA_START=270 /DNA_END=463 /DNA_ORIENTATION=-
MPPPRSLQSTVAATGSRLPPWSHAAPSDVLLWNSGVLEKLFIAFFRRGCRVSLAASLHWPSPAAL